jgi:hypothetical protein
LFFDVELAPAGVERNKQILFTKLWPAGQLTWSMAVAQQ